MDEYFQFIIQGDSVVRGPKIFIDNSFGASCDRIILQKGKYSICGTYGYTSGSYLRYMFVYISAIDSHVTYMKNLVGFNAKKN